MKPAKLRRVIGRRVDAYFDGRRIGLVVAAPATDTLTVEFGPHGRHRIDVRSVVGVFWRGRKRQLDDFLEHAGPADRRERAARRTRTEVDQ